MKLSHTLRATSAAFDDPNLVSAGGLVPVLALAESAGLRDLADEHLSVPTDKGANAGLKVASLVGGMVCGADSIDDMALLRHGGMGRVFARAYAPSTLGSFLRAFTFGHVRQLDAVASRFLIAVAGLTRLAGRRGRSCRGHRRGPGTRCSMSTTRSSRSTATPSRAPGSATPVSVGSTHCSPRSRPLTTAPVIVAQRLRKGAAGSPRGAKRLVGDAVRTARRLLGKTQLVLVRMDSAFYGRGPVHAALAGGAAVSVTVRMDKAVKKAIATIPDQRVDHDRVHRRRLRRDHRPLDLSGRGRRARLHRLRCAEEVRPGARAAGGAPDPRLQRRDRTRPPARTPCSTCGASTRSSPPPTPRSSTPSPPTRPTAITPSSSRSTPT